MMGPVRNEDLKNIRPGDSVCVVINDQANMWCKVIARVVAEECYVCLSSYPIPRFDLKERQRMVVHGSEVINISAGLDHSKPWRDYYVRSEET